MDKLNKMLNKADNGYPLSRRGFVKGVAGLSGIGALYGCSTDDDPLVYDTIVTDDGITSEDLFYTENPVYRYGTTSHNCGGRCVTKAQVTSDGRIVRFLTDETLTAYNGSVINNDNPNTTQSRACSRCRSYRGRLYHPGRLKYPLKQTLNRGNANGFMRITWQEALSEIAQRMKAVQTEYGPETVHAVYACGNIYTPIQGASYSGVFASNDQVSPALRLLGGASAYTSDYSFHQCSYAGGWYGTAYSGYNLDGQICLSPSANDIAGVGKYVMLWGSNTPTTHNHLAFSWVKGIEDMKARDPESNVTYIGPEFSEIGISQADTWIQILPYTDVALIIGMIGEMLTDTFNTDGSLANGPLALDLDYIDTMVYGFFDSPQYYIDATDGSITNTAGAGLTLVNEVPSGMSLSAYIMGDDDRITLSDYGTSNYIANQYTTNLGQTKRNLATCAYVTPANTKYAYKQDFQTLKNADWASAITGIPAATIRNLAQTYINAGRSGDPIWNEWSGGQLKQSEGVITLYALQTLMILTNNWGRTGTGVMNQGITPSFTQDAGQFSVSDVTPTTWGSVTAMRPNPTPSVTQWHSAVKYAFKDELATNGYVPNIPDWDPNQIVYSDDGGVKGLVTRAGTLSTALTEFSDSSAADGVTRTYYSYVNTSGATVSRLGDGTNAKVAGFRFILNTGGNIPVNQHSNTVDSSRMYEALPTYGYGDYEVSNMEDAFYLVTFDNFMSPTARYSDYVLPAATSWEQPNFMNLNNGSSASIYIDDVIAAPGESKSTWDFARDLINAYGGASAAAQFTGASAGTDLKDIIVDKFLQFSASGTKADGTTPFAYAGQTWAEFLEKPFKTPVPNVTITTEVANSTTRQALDTYLASGTIATTPFASNITTVDATNAYGFGTGYFAETETCPNQSTKFHVYSGSLVWRYENLYSKWHGYLPFDEQGQTNTDSEGSPLVYPIIMYFNYQDYFMDAYGLSDSTALEGRYLLTTTHDRFRAHSSLSENPYLRELTHSVIGGALYSGNDAGTYAISSDPTGNFNDFPAINSMIGSNGLPVTNASTIASYADIWVNPNDFASYNDGDLVEVSNEIGSVYCTIRKTNRCVSGFVGLHQGCWFDPRDISGKTVDVGGNCNTLMASKPSRADHGNAQQSAMVSITKVNV